MLGIAFYANSEIYRLYSVIATIFFLLLMSLSKYATFSVVSPMAQSYLRNQISFHETQAREM